MLVYYLSTRSMVWLDLVYYQFISLSTIHDQLSIIVVVVISISG